MPLHINAAMAPCTLVYSRCDKLCVLDLKPGDIFGPTVDGQVGPMTETVLMCAAPPVPFTSPRGLPCLLVECYHSRAYECGLGESVWVFRL